MLLERVAMSREQPIGRSEQHALGGEGRIELFVEHMAVEREQASCEPGAGAGRPRCIVEKCLAAGGVAGQELGEQASGHRSFGARPSPQTPGLRLEETDVGPHPVFVTPIGQGERFKCLEGLPTAVVCPSGGCPA